MALIALLQMAVPVMGTQYLTGRGWGRLSAFGFLQIMDAHGKLVPTPRENLCLVKQGSMAIR